MFKKSKLLFTIILSNVLVFSGCQTKSQAVDASYMLLGAQDKMQQLNNYEITKNVEIQLKTVDQDKLDIVVSSDIKQQQRPVEIYAINTSNNITVGDETQEFTMQQYLQKKETGYVLYTDEASDNWTQDTPEEGKKLEEIIKSPISNIKDYIENNSSIILTGSKNIDGISCHEIQVSINKDRLPYIIKQMGMLQDIGLDEEEIITKLHKLETAEAIKLNIYLDKKTGYFIGQDIDLSDVMKDIVAQAQGIMEEQMDDFSFVFELRYSHIDELEEIELPEEIKAAEIAE